MYNYSFIIPHKNNLRLLQRCLKSIPQREDIQTIVVDDGSKCQDEIIAIKRENLEIICLKQSGRGAGFVRNQGLLLAKGKWVLFIDCDDFYEEGILDVLDKYCDKDIDVLYFNFKGVYNDSLQPYGRYNKTARLYDEYDGTITTLDRLRYQITMPWNKMISRHLIEASTIRFEEVPKGNDVRFSFMVGYFARKIAVEKQPLYYWTMQPHSITHQPLTAVSCLHILKMRVKSRAFLAYVGKKSHGIASLVLRYLVYNSIGDAVKIIVTYFKKHKEVYSEENLYVEHVAQRIIYRETEQTKY